MIKKEELRCGNKVAVDKGRYIATVLTIRQSVMDVMYVDKGQYAPPLPEDGIHGYASWAYEHAEPIPLTTDLLWKAGLGDGQDIGGDSTYIREQEGVFYLVCDFVKVSDRPIQYLHHLQNLFYCLTGQELELHL
jgi:hypothetical protein